MAKSLWLRLGFPLATWLWLFWPSLDHMVTVWLNSKTYEHCFLILPICLWLVWRQRDEIRNIPLSVSGLAACLLGIPCLLWLMGRAADIGLFEHLAAVMSLQLLLWAILGTAIARALWFPLLYLFFAVPFGESLVPQLQIITADLSVWLLNLSNIPVYREGLYLTIPNGRFYVAEACSGIRFLMSSVALGTLFAYLQFTKTYKRLCFVAFSFVFPIIANGIRAFGIVIIGYWSDMKYAAGADHLIYGWVFFSLIILVIFFTASRFSDAELPPTDHNQTKTPTSPRAQKRVFVSVFCLFGLTALWHLHLTHHAESTNALPNSATNRTGTDTTSAEAGITTVNETRTGASNTPLTTWGITFPKAINSQRHSAAEGKAEIYTASYNLWQRDGELISSTNQLFNQDTWSLQRSRGVQLQSGVHAKTMTIANARGDTMHLVYWYCINEFCSSNPLAIKLVRASYRLAGLKGVSNVTAVASSELGETEITQFAGQNEAVLVPSM
ncbi:exosortase A (plasmid) [Photobacterium sp. GJ3]|uniref:exosortase A n=1 Tax=Photobacterium sp. GJ3 TaxID=2829502 RepID=UPI001B8BE12D|nr:exosortase A [Photobacterium sp. GJ3]QUJ69310.1 exosortase A [Photobacterium sp. GJ3]